MTNNSCLACSSQEINVDLKAAFENVVLNRRFFSWEDVEQAVDEFQSAIYLWQALPNYYKYMTHRRLRVLVIVFVATWILCSTFIYNNYKTDVNTNGRGKLTSKLLHFDIRVLAPNSTCRHIKQSPILLADELGYLCNYLNLLKNSCCPFQNLTQRFVCHSCKFNHCCSVYEHCVSCCLNPTNKPLWDQVMQNANANSRRHLKLAIDAFEFCVAVCRTSSLTVLHENKYRNLDEIYCFGLETPSI
uniref:SREBP regulating gene protein n=1 Tax=Schistosoma japonicum TaxID=6182 RepID=Q5DGQ4_SCHJA|nr:SJCHGC02079 protein [Schistosoma japonicum]